MRGAKRDSDTVDDVRASRLTAPDTKATVTHFDMPYPCSDKLVKAAVR